MSAATMATQAGLTDQYIKMRAQTRYAQLKSVVETPATIGQFITIDVLSGDYAVGPSHIDTVATVRAQHENVETFTLRIGYTTTYARGGRMVRSA